MKTPTIKPIKGHPNYIIDENGKVWNQTTHQRVKEYVNPNGFSYVVIDGYWKTIAYLMKAAFFPNDGNMCVRHKDGDRTNNRLSNLYTFFDGSETLDGEGNERKRLFMEVTPETNEVIRFWNTAKEIADDMGMSESYIRQQIRSRRTVNGRKFDQYNSDTADMGLFDYTDGKRKIKVYDPNDRMIGIAKSYTEAGKMAGVTSQGVTNALDERRRTKKGYRFEWSATEDEETPKVKKPKKVKVEKPKRIIRKVEQCDKEGELIKVWESVKVASEATGIKKANIRSVIEGNTKTAGGFVWRYAKADETAEVEEVKERKPKGKPITQYDTKGNIINQWVNVAQASQATGITSGNIRASLNGVTTKAGGYVWRWKDDPFYKFSVTPSTPEPSREVKEKPKRDPSTYKRDTMYTKGNRLCQYDTEGNLLKVWETASEAAQTLDINLALLGRAAKGKVRSAGGYFWGYEGEPFNIHSRTAKHTNIKKPLYQLTEAPDGNGYIIVNEWDGINEAARELGVPASSLSLCAKEPHKYKDGYWYSYTPTL